MEENKKMLGHVVWFSKSYGFIRPDDDDQDIFVYWSDIDTEGFKTLKKNQKVEFSKGMNIRGQPKAVNVKPL